MSRIKSIKQFFSDHYAKVSGVNSTVSSITTFINNVLLQTGILDTALYRIPFLILFLPLIKGPSLIFSLYKNTKKAYQLDKLFHEKEHRFLRNYWNTIKTLLKLLSSIILIAAAIVCAFLITPFISIGISLLIVTIQAYREWCAMQSLEQKLQYINPLNTEKVEQEVERLLASEKKNIIITNSLAITSLMLMIPVTLMLTTTIILPPIGAILLLSSLILFTVISLMITKKAVHNNSHKINKLIEQEAHLENGPNSFEMQEIKVIQKESPSEAPEEYFKNLHDKQGAFTDSPEEQVGLKVKSHL